MPGQDSGASFSKTVSAAVPVYHDLPADRDAYFQGKNPIIKAFAGGISSTGTFLTFVADQSYALRKIVLTASLAGGQSGIPGSYRYVAWIGWALSAADLANFAQVTIPVNALAMLALAGMYNYNNTTGFQKAAAAMGSLAVVVDFKEDEFYLAKGQTLYFGGVVAAEVDAGSFQVNFATVLHLMSTYGMASYGV